MFGRTNEPDLMEIVQEDITNKLPVVTTVKPKPHSPQKPHSPVKRPHSHVEKDIENANDSVPESPTKRARVTAAPQPEAKKQPGFKGQSKKHYQRTFELVQNNIGELDFKSLGKVSSDPQFYFEENDANAFAKDFLTWLWSDAALLSETKGLLEDKVNLVEINPTRSPQAPACISFVTAKIQDKMQYFVAISGKDCNEKLPAYFMLEQFIDSYRYNNSKVALLHGNIDDFNRLLGAVANNSDTRTIQKPCAEKFFSSCLAKLFFEHKNNISISGVVNCAFYPFQKGIKVPENSMVLAPTAFTELACGVGISAAKIPCCSACQSNKQAVLTVLHHASLASEKINEAEPRLTSPIKSSIRNFKIFSPNSKTRFFGERPPKPQEPKGKQKLNVEAAESTSSSLAMKQ